jgi:hypothetical protein
MGSFILMKLSGSNSAVECDLAKVEVAGSIPVSRSIFLEPRTGEGFSSLACPLQRVFQVNCQVNYPAR